MKIHNMPRGSGKTQKLIQISADTGAYILCRSKEEASRIFQSASSRDLDIPFPLTFSEISNKEYYGKGIKAALIDDVDEFIWHMCYLNVTDCTYTAE